MKPDAILASDLHIRETVPECRLDDFMETQARKYKWLTELQEKLDIPILVAGDIFHHWKPSPWLLGWCLKHLPDNIIAIPGQHDLSSHNLDTIEKTGVYVLEKAGKIRLLTESKYTARYNDLIIQGFPWGIELTSAKPYRQNQFPIALVHKLVYKSKPPFPGAENVGGTGKALIKKMPGFDLIVTGDNHQTFTETDGQTILVNCGSFTRQTAAQIDHKPSVFLWYSETNDVKQVFVPIENDVISREHIEIENKKDERIEAFVSSLTTNVEISISFEENMKTTLANNEISEAVKTIIKEAMEND